MNRAERELIGLAIALLDGKRKLTPRERTLQRQGMKPTAKMVVATRKLIKAGEDPLGNLFCKARPASLRRALGATYTPDDIVAAMVGWAKLEAKTPSRIVDPGAGSGRFIMGAAIAFPKASLLAVEIDPLAALTLRANAAVKGFGDRLTVMVEDYRSITLPAIKGPTLFIGNPPYVRHHDIGTAWKSWFGDNSKIQGFKASKLAGLHIHFFLKTRELGRPGDFGTFITSSEWLDVNYGSVLRQMLADGLGGTSLHVINPNACLFPDAMTTGAITCFRVGNRPDQLTVRKVESLADLAHLSEGESVNWRELEIAPQWSPFINGHAYDEEGSIELGELFRVHRGQVTGKNSIWIENPAMESIPARFLYPTVTRARELIAAGGSLSSAKNLRRVLDLPYDLASADLSANERKVVERFLKWAKLNEAHSSYVANHRRSWWSVQLRSPAVILCTYMARRAPAFVLNKAGARHLNIAHGLYPREPMSEGVLSALLTYLHRTVTTAGGRTYAGGLVKFEPRELERLRIPALHRLHEQVAESVDLGRIAGGRGCRQGQIQA